ncbi:hypothetical protein CP533_2269 [Ophiocordyceps camponoti-saundersi (nom. inval.)]|nr:hypothetical protein CP533_2269 [Ophiocordyceps camponoti-saundersi (nom. inval.)]
MQPNELASLLSRTLTFNNNNPDHPQPETIPRLTDPSSPSPYPSSSPQRVVPYSVSQHYNHSAHHHQQVENDNTAAVLGSYGIDATVLTPSQIRLFGVADDAQKLRLMELWSICPPARPLDIPAQAWSSNTVEHEELLARLRSDGSHQQLHHHHQQQQQQQQDNFVNSVMSLDGTPVQTADGTWSPSSSFHASASASTEPYMLSGYEELMRRQRERDAYTPATDPIYRGPDLARHQQHLHMAMQYGAAEHFRTAPEADAMDVM